MKILVSGTSIAGSAAAFWLNRAGHDVTLIERAAQPRAAGQNIDVRGPGREVLRRMDLEAQALACNTGEIGISFIDDSGVPLCRIPAGVGDSDGPTAALEILRGELSRLLMDTLDGGVDVRFGQQISAIDETGGGARVRFADQRSEDFDLVVIAEGATSRTRTLVFGEVPHRELGLYTAYGTIARQRDDDLWWTWYTAPGGRTVNLRPDNKGTTRVALSFLSAPSDYEGQSLADQKATLRRIFQDVGWRVSAILDLIDGADELYLDYLTQVRASSYSRGSVVLLGDAAWCATPISGVGATLALVGAYVLAGELSEAGSVDDRLRAYQRTMQIFVAPAHKLPPGAPRLAHPKTRLGVAVLRTGLRIVGSRPVRSLSAALPTRAVLAPQLPRYAAL